MTISINSEANEKIYFLPDKASDGSENFIFGRTNDWS